MRYLARYAKNYSNFVVIAGHLLPLIYKTAKGRTHQYYPSLFYSPSVGSPWRPFTAPPRQSLQAVSALGLIAALYIPRSDDKMAIGY